MDDQKNRKVIVLSNFQDLFPPGKEGTDTPRHGSDFKALLWAKRPGALFISSTAADLRPISFIEKLYSPGEPLLIPQTGVTEGLLANPRHFDRLLRYLGDARELEFVCTVYSAAAAQLIGELKRQRPGLTISGIPSCSPGFIAYLNTKTGGRDFLSQIPQLAPLLPRATVCYSLENCAALLAQQKDPARFIVKINRGVGGAGMLRGGHPSLERALKDSLENGKKGKVAVSFDSLRHEPFILEELVGDLSENLSITADFCVDTEVRTIGIARQILENSFCYSGIQYDPEQLPTSLTSQIGETGRLIGEMLRTRGYIGYFNVDFIVYRENLSLAEINVRRSAPLDQFLLLRRLFGQGWEERVFFTCLEQARLPESAVSLSQIVRFLRQENLLYREDCGIIPLSSPFEREGQPQACLLFLAPTEVERTRLMEQYHGRLSE